MSSNQTTSDLDFGANIPFDEILTNPILDIAARFWDSDRYEAFKVCYRSMRRIDDLVDHRKAKGDLISDMEASQYERMIGDWLKSVREREITDDYQKQFLTTIHDFSIPLWPWERLSRSMMYDLRNDGFPSFLSFLRYCEGAAISPAAIFMHLSGISRKGNEILIPDYDIRLAARPLALFSYIVHIIRDFQKDTLENLLYFSTDLLNSEGLDMNALKQIAESGRPTDSFRRLIVKYRSFGEFYRRKARLMIDDVRPSLEPRYQLSLEIIYSLYLQIFERIDPSKGSFTAEELNPQPEQVKERLQLTINQFVPSEK